MPVTPEEVRRASARRREAAAEMERLKISLEAWRQELIASEAVRRTAQNRLNGLYWARDRMREGADVAEDSGDFGVISRGLFYLRGTERGARVQKVAGGWEGAGEPLRSADAPAIDAEIETLASALKD